MLRPRPAIRHKKPMTHGTNSIFATTHERQYEHARIPVFKIFYRFAPAAPLLPTQFRCNAGSEWKQAEVLDGGRHLTKEIAMDSIKQAWLNIYKAAGQSANQATDPALKKHFLDEQKQIKQTLDAMDIDTGNQQGGKSLKITINIGGGDDGDITDGPPKKSLALAPAGIPSAPPQAPAAPPAPPVPPPAQPPAAQPPVAPPPQAPTQTVPTQVAPASSSDVDSNKKLEQLKPFIDKAAGLSGVDPSLLGAVMVKESRGVSIDAMKNAGGLMQLSSADFDLAKAKHSELNGLDPSSTEGQIMGTAFRLKDLKDKSGSWDGALTMYNGGENGGGHLNDPNYVTRVNEYKAIIDQGGQLPS